MKRRLVPAAIAAAVLSVAPAQAQQTPEDDPIGDLAGPGERGGGSSGGALRSLYAGGGLAVQSVTGYEDGYAVVGKVGTYFRDAREGLGAELEASRSLIEPEQGAWGGGGNDVALTTLAGYSTFTVRHPEQPLAVRARLGLAWEYADPDGGDSETELNVSYGIGGTADLANGFTAFVDYTHIEADVGHLNLGIQTRF